jgi:hypothetical protein
LAIGLALAGFMHLPALAQALGFGHPGQGFIFFHLLQNRCCIIRSYLLQTVISKGDTDMYQIDSAGIECFDVRTKSGAYCGIVVKRPRGWVWFWNSTATRGSKRLFNSVSDAIEFMHNRRVSKGWA